MHCAPAAVLFVAGLACVILGHTFGVIAWRHRLPQYSRSRWLTDPTYAFRSSYYRDPKPRIRLVAATLQAAGALMCVALAVYLMVLDRSGVTHVCGFEL